MVRMAQRQAHHAGGSCSASGTLRIIPGTRREGENTFKGYLRCDFAEAFATYLPDQTVTPSQPNNDGHCDALQTVTPDRDVTFQKCHNPITTGIVTM